MNAGYKQDFVRINIPDATQKLLIQQKCFDHASPLPKPFVEFVERDAERVGPQLCDAFRSGQIEVEAAELANIVEAKDAIVELQNRPGIGSGGSVPEKLASHAEVDVNQSMIKLQKDVFSQPIDGLDASAGYRARSLFKSASRDQARVKRSGANDVTRYVRDKRADDSFDFRKFGQEQVVSLMQVAIRNGPPTALITTLVIVARACPGCHASHEG